MTDYKQIGTVEILKLRCYPLDPDSFDPAIAIEVVVEPGVYPVYSNGYTNFWVMTGRVNETTKRFGDGLFLIGGQGVAKPSSAPPVTFHSRWMGPDEWQELLDHPSAREGHIDQRLRFIIIDKED